MKNLPFGVASRQPHLGTSIFAVMTSLASRENAINLSQGFPDFSSPSKLVELVHKYMRVGHNQYAPMPGVMTLREALAEKTKKFYNAEYDPEQEITITTGATEALYCAISSIVHPGDEVIVFEPWYDAYIPVIEYNNGNAVPIPMKMPGLSWDWEAAQKAVNEKTRAIILNSPHNPGGNILRDEDISRLVQITKKTSIILIADEVYEHIIFDGHKHLSLAGVPQLAERSFVISSMGKSYHTTGWKVGYCMAPKELTTELRKIHQFVTFAVNTPVQYAYAEILKEVDYFAGLTQFYQEKRDLFVAGAKNSRFSILPCYGTYFQLLGFENISDENDYDFAVRLTREFKIASIPVSVFYGKKDDHKILRFCFAKKEKTLKKALDILCKI